MSQNDKVRVGMVGVGGFGGRRRELLRQSGNFEIVAAYDLNEKALQRAKEQDGAEPAGSYEELLETPGLEAMVISTGAKFHAEQALAAMEKGLHVFVEKPLCSTLEEMQALLEKQRQTGLVVGLGHNDHTHDKYSLTTRRLIEAGALGTVATFEKTTAHSGGHHIKPGDWRGDPEKNPGGMLFQCGVHGVHELLFYFGPVAEVEAMMRYDVHTTGTADVAHCTLKFRSGLIGVLSAYHVTPYRHTLNIFGTKANLYREARYGEIGTVMERQDVHLDGSFEPREEVPLEGEEDPAGGVKSFYRAIREGGEPYPSLKDGARAVAVIFAAEEAAKSGRAVPVAAVD